MAAPRRGLLARRWTLAIAALIALGAVAAGTVLTGTFRTDEGTSDLSALSAETPGVERLIEAMEADSPRALYQAFSTRGRAGLTEAEFIRSYGAQKRRTGAIAEAAVRGPFRTRETAEGAVGSARMRIDYEAAGPETYKAYFLFEDGQWRFWFTGAVDPARGA